MVSRRSVALDSHLRKTGEMVSRRSVALDSRLRKTSEMVSRRMTKVWSVVSDKWRRKT